MPIVYHLHLFPDAFPDTATKTCWIGPWCIWESYMLVKGRRPPDRLIISVCHHLSTGAVCEQSGPFSPHPNPEQLKNSSMSTNRL